jgi:hypothetical protein
VLRHPVRCGFAQAFGILVNGGSLVIVGFRVIDESLAVAFYLDEAAVLSAF